MELINQYLSGALVPFALVFCSILFFARLRGRPMSKPFVIIKSLFKKKKGSGASPIRAVIFALAGTLGVGNIVGVASAIALGGAGAVFWMWVSAFFAMILKYGEVVLAVMHRRLRGQEYCGGAMYYMKDFFKSCKKIGNIFTFAFAILCLINGFTMGCIIQSNAIASSFASTLGFNEVLVGALLAILSIIVFFLNGKKIFSLCERLVPFVSLLYILMSLAVILPIKDKVPFVFEEILEGAFSFRSAGAGALGFFMSKALRYGTIRGLFSNEAGCGSSPIAHATANTNSAVEQGFLGIFEVFIDTILICTMTALVILLNWDSAVYYLSSPIMMAFAAFSGSLGDISNILLSVSVFLFAFATIVCWGYYGKECIYFLNPSKRAEKLYYALYVIFVFVGSYISLDFIWELADFAVGGMTIMNLLIISLMSGEVKRETDLYFEDIRYTKQSLSRKTTAPFTQGSR